MSIKLEQTNRRNEFMNEILLKESNLNPSEEWVRSLDDKLRTREQLTFTDIIILRRMVHYVMGTKDE